MRGNGLSFRKCISLLAAAFLILFLLLLATGFAESYGKDDELLKLSDFATMNAEEQQEFLDKLVSMSPGDLNAVMSQSMECLTDAQKERLNSWVSEHYDFSKLEMDIWDSENTTNEDADTARTGEGHGKDDELLKLSDFATMNAEEQQEFLYKLVSMSPGDLNAVMSQSMESLTDAQKERLNSWVSEHYDFSKLEMDIWDSENTANEPLDTAETGRDRGETDYFSKLTDEEKQQTLDTVSKMSQEEIGNLIASLRTQVSAGDLQAFVSWLAQHHIALPADIAAVTNASEEDGAITSISQLTDAEKSELLDMISRMTAEQFNAYIAMLRCRLSEDAMNEFIDWLAAVYHLDTSCRAFHITLPTTFALFGSVPWPENVSLPEQGSICRYSQGGKAVEIQIQFIAAPTYEDWKNAVLESEFWKEDADGGKKKVAKALKDNFGPGGYTPEEHFTEVGIKMEDVAYFAATAGDACGYVAFGANNAILFVSAK